METSPSPAPAPSPEGPALSPLARAVAVYIRPGSAWGGLRQHVQWWIPLLVVTLLATGVAALLHHRAVVPMVVDTWRDQVANGQLQQEQADRMEQFFDSPTGLMFSVGQQFLVFPVITLLTSLLVWFGVAFILGRTMSYRLALEVVSWSGLITIPATTITAALAWSRETMKGIHVGWGVLLPEAESPSKLTTGLGIFLDALGPLSLWYLAVLVLGASALSGAPRKQTAWVLGGLYLALVLLFAALGAMFTPGT